MIRPIKYFLFTFLFSSLLYSQVIDRIEVNGNTAFSDSEIESWAGIGTGTRIYDGMMDTLKSRIAYNLSLNGYLNPDFSESTIDFSSDSQQVELIIYVDEGGPSYINEVIVSCNDPFRLNSIRPIFNFLKGQILNQAELEEYINDSLTKLENEGYPFSVFTISSIHFFYDSTCLKNDE